MRILDKDTKNKKDDNWCHYSGLPSPKDYVDEDEEWEANSTWSS